MMDELEKSEREFKRSRSEREAEKVKRQREEEDIKEEGRKMMREKQGMLERERLAREEKGKQKETEVQDVPPTGEPL